MAGVLLLANGKKAQGGEANEDWFTREVCYQTSKIGSGQRALAGWSVARLLPRAPRSPGSLHRQAGSLCPGCRMVERELPTSHCWPLPNSTVARGTQAAEGRRRECDLAAVQGRPIEWEKRTRVASRPHVRNTELLGV